MPVIRRLSIDNRWIIALFFLKIIAGLAIGWVSINIYGHGNDYWDLNDAAFKEFQLLMTHPGKFFCDIFISDYPSGYGGMFSSTNSYWNDLKGNLLIKLVAVFDIFSRGNYYINSLFFNFIIFFGNVFLYKLYINIFPGQKKLLIIVCFLLPSSLYFCSGMHKDGVVFLLLALLIYCLYKMIEQKQLAIKYILFATASSFLLVIIRNYVFIAVVPALAAWVISKTVTLRPVFIFILVYTFAFGLLFVFQNYSGNIKPLDVVIAKQTSFLNLVPAKTQIELTPLQSSFQSFTAVLPQAINHSLLRPYLWELPVISLLPLNIELFVYQVIFVIFIFGYKKTTDGVAKQFIFFITFFVLSILLFIGFIVPNLGAIVRYRSVYFPFVLPLLICLIDWGKSIQKLKLKK